MDPLNAQELVPCNLCETSIVQMHCVTCFVQLCKACVGEHISTDELKNHKVVKFESRNSTPLFPPCASHGKEQCEMYCRHCDVPVCHTCLGSGKHFSHKLSKIVDVLDEKKNLIRKEHNELNKTIYPTYQNIAVDVQKTISQLETEYGDLSTAVTKYGANLHREIDQLARKLITQLDEMKTLQLQTLKTQLGEINKTIAEIKDEMDSLDIAVDSNDISKLCSVKSRLNHYKNLPKKILPSVPKFTPEKIQIEEVRKLFGALKSDFDQSEEHRYSIKKTQKVHDVESCLIDQTSPETRCVPPVKKLLENPKFTSNGITFSGSPLNLACLKNDTFWVCGDSSTMALYDDNQLSLRDSFHQEPPIKRITTKSGKRPAVITVSRRGRLIYTDYKNRTVNIVMNENILKVIELKNWRPQGVCSTFSGDLLITMERDDNKQSRVFRYSGSKEKQSIQFDSEGNRLYSSDGSHKYICENNNLDICVADSGGQAVVVVNHEGKLRFRYTGHTPAPENKPFSPKGITTDSQSHILTSDSNNYCVHIIDEDGHFLRYINFEKCSISGLCTDTKDNLFLLRFKKLNFFQTLSHVTRIKYLE